MAWLSSASAAWAHPHHTSTGHGEHAFAHGLLHSIMGLDHGLAMVAVGFALAMAGLCATGLGAGRLLQRHRQAALVRACGGGIATAGLVLAAVTWL